MTTTCSILLRPSGPPAPAETPVKSARPTTASGARISRAHSACLMAILRSLPGGRMAHATPSTRRCEGTNRSGRRIAAEVRRLERKIVRRLGTRPAALATRLRHQLVEETRLALVEALG